jgi:hypothetical protein
MSRDLGLILIGLGAVVVVLGLIGFAGGLTWFGRLPGDIRYENGSGNVRVYAPIVSMLLISVVASVLIAIARRLL